MSPSLFPGDADDKALGEYERFEVRRREVAEARGEAEALRALEDVARKLPKRRGRKAKGGESGAGRADG